MSEKASDDDLVSVIRFVDCPLPACTAPLSTEDLLRYYDGSPSWNDKILAIQHSVSLPSRIVLAN